MEPVCLAGILVDVRHGGCVVAVHADAVRAGAAVPFDVARMARRGSQNPIAQYEEMANSAASNILEKAAQIAKSQGITCELVHVQDQYPAEGIIATAKDKSCDLIVMASHGRRGIDRLLLGSQANEVLTHSKVPALIVR